ncbi:MAG: hypothetical protein IPP72_21810 [Chitinophagaceae bacterium]|nr:hypothetical protein [Chitinophagaceae bacterium]
MLKPPLYQSILLVVVLLFGVKTQAQREYFFSHYSTASGLLSNQVNTVLQDGEGYIWIGGTDGLQRYDGVRYQSFRHRDGDSLSLPSNPVLQLMLDKQKRLWVLLANGDAGIFNRRDFTFHKVTVKPKKAGSVYSAHKWLTKDEYGNIFYMFFASELLTWNEQKSEFSYTHNFFSLKPEWTIADIAQQPGTHKYWIGVQGLGIAIYNADTKQWSYPGNNIEKEPATDAFDRTVHPNQMLFDKRGRCWFFCWTSVYPNVFCFDTKTNVAEKFELLTAVKAYHEINGFFEQQDGTIWVRGVKVFAKLLEKEKKFQLVYNGYRNEHSIAYEIVTALFEDREGSIWTGTDNNGLYRFNPSQEYFTNVSHVNRMSGKTGNGSPMSFIETNRGGYFVGTWEDGLYHYDSNFTVTPAHIKGLDDNAGPFVWTMAASADSNTIWMGSQPGIYVIDQAKRVAGYYDPASLQHKTVRQLAEDNKGNLWIGMIHSGVYKWKAVNGKVQLKEEPVKFASIPSDGINKIMVDRKGMVWIATAASGLFMIDPSTDEVLLHFERNAAGRMKLPEEGVSAVLDYNDSLVVITTVTKLLLYNRRSQKMYNVGPPDGISGYIAAVEKDQHGFVWITTSSGLYRVGVRKGVFVRFNKEDGIQNDNFVLSASRQLKDGRLLFGSSNHFIMFDPSSISFRRSDLQVTITNFEVMNKELPVDSLLHLKQIVLGYDENALAVSFSSLLYNSPSLIQYKLDGLDKEWKTADKNYTATYSYLPPGEYILLFKMFDESGNIKESDLRLSIKINSPFWKSWWFFCLLVLLTGSLVFWFDRARMKRKEAVQKMRSDIAGNLHQEVNTALSNINILSEMARLKADTEPKKSKEFIEQIHSRSQNMIVAIDDMLWSITPENDSMEKTVERMQEFIEGLNKQYNIDLQLLVDEKVVALKPDMQFRHEVLLLFKETIKGLVKAGAGNGKIHAGMDKNNLLYTIQFKNDSCDMQQITNLLQSQGMQGRLTKLKAAMHVEVTKVDSTLLLRVPLR